VQRRLPGSLPESSPIKAHALALILQNFWVLPLDPPDPKERTLGSSDLSSPLENLEAAASD